MPRVSDIFGRQFLRGTDLPNPIVATIESWGTELIWGENIHFLTFHNQAAKLKLSPTNANDLALLFGEDLDGWVNRAVELFAVTIEITDRKTGEPKMVEMIRCRAPNGPAGGSVPPKSSGGGDLDDEIPFITADGIF
jgi:hypothetical protein